MYHDIGIVIDLLTSLTSIILILCIDIFDLLYFYPFKTVIKTAHTNLLKIIKDSTVK